MKILTSSHREILPYKERTPFETRRSMALQYLNAAPPRIPIIVSPNPESKAQLGTANTLELKLLFEVSNTTFDIRTKLREKLKVSEDLSVYIWVKGKIVNQSRQGTHVRGEHTDLSPAAL